MAIWLVLVPMLLAIVYYTFFAQSRFVSVSQITVRQAGHDSTTQVPSLAYMLGGGVNPASREETLYLREFITSSDMFNVLQKKLGWKEHYAGKWEDPFYLVFQDASNEFWLWYYRRMVTAQFDEETGLLLVQVQAFSPDFAQRSLQAILAESDAFVNDISRRMALEQVRFAQSELEIARNNYEGKREELLQFQSKNNLLDAQATAESRSAIIATLEADVTREKANLTGLLASLNAESPQVRQQRTKISALEQQLVVEKKRLVSAPSGDQLNVVASRYRNLTVNASIAEDGYKYALTSVENARAEAVKKMRSLITVVNPNLPDLAVYPSRIYNLITLFIALLLFYGIVRFIIATVDDHRD